MTKIISFYNLIKKVNLNLIKLILVFLLLKTYPCFATNNLIISINDTKIILEGDFVQGGLVKGKINKDLDIKFKEKVLRKTSDGNFVLVLEEIILKANLYFFKSKLDFEKIRYKQRKYKTQVINGLEKNGDPTQVFLGKN